MPSPLDQFGEDQTRRDNADVAGAQHSLGWAETFRSTPPVNVLRARANYVEAVDRAFTNKLELESRTSLKAMEMKAKAAEYQEERALAPLKEEALRARIAATGATERRKSEQAKLEASQTIRLNDGMAKLYKSGLHPNTPEFQTQAVDILASNPFAHTDHIKELGQAAGFSKDLSPQEYIAEAVKLKQAATEAGLSNPTVKSFSGRPTIVEGAAVVTPEQSIDNAVKRKQALQAVDPPKTEKPPKRETFEQFNKELAAAVSAYGGESKVPREVWDSFEKRKAAITAPETPTTAPAGAPAPGQPAASPAAPKLKPLDDAVAKAARAAIAAGKDAAAVANRLKESGYDPSGL